jgi:hypothetical protein
VGDGRAAGTACADDHWNSRNGHTNGNSRTIWGYYPSLVRHSAFETACTVFVVFVTACDLFTNVGTWVKGNFCRPFPVIRARRAKDQSLVFILAAFNLRFMALFGAHL